MAVLRTTVEGSARAGIAAFGGALTLGGATLECNAIDIAAEEYEGFAPAFDDQGANDCGCATERIACAAETTGFVPPGAVAPTPDPEHE